MFSNPANRAKLNGMTHPRIFKKTMRQIFYHRVLQCKSMVVLDAPLLYESKILEHFCYPIIVVSLKDRETQLNRLMERNKELSTDEANKKIDSQMPMELKVSKSDLVVQNDGTV